jgi:hypothetical protein
MKIYDKRSFFLAIIWLMVGLAGIAAVFLRSSQPIYYKGIIGILSLVMLGFSIDSFRHAFSDRSSGGQDGSKE